SPGSTTNTSGIRGGFGSASTLTRQDAAALADHQVAPDIQTVAPISTSSASLVRNGTNWTTTLTGTSESWSPLRSRGVVEGRFIPTADDQNVAAVVVLGPDTVPQLFGTTDPIGQTVADNGVQLEVVGVLQPLSSSESTSNNDLAIVPLSTYQQKLV